MRSRLIWVCASTVSASSRHANEQAAAAAMLIQLEGARRESILARNDYQRLRSPIRRKAGWMPPTRLLLPRRCGPGRHRQQTQHPASRRCSILLVGQKISITSRKAQTARHRITGMRTLGATQFVFVDTPGFQTLHANALDCSLNKTVVGAVSDVDLSPVCGGSQQLHRGGRACAEAARLRYSHGVDRQQTGQRASPRRHRAVAADHAAEARLCRVRSNVGKEFEGHRAPVRHLREIPARSKPGGMPNELSDRGEQFLASEMVREKLFHA